MEPEKYYMLLLLLLSMTRCSAEQEEGGKQYTVSAEYSSVSFLITGGVDVRMSDMATPSVSAGATIPMVSDTSPTQDKENGLAP